MLDFTFHNPTRIYFGQGRIAELDRAVPADARVFLTLGGGSVKKNGTYDEVVAALGGRTVSEFWGIEPNPSYETAMSAIAQARREKATFLLAVGGGSVIDATKFIAAAVPYVGEDPWDIVAKGAPVKEALPLGTVLTLPGTGSEMNANLVMTRKSSHAKLGMSNSLLFPRFSVLDPRKTFSLPSRQIANGVVDAFVHIVEQYVSYPVNAPIQDRYAEALLLTLLEEGPKALATPEDYEVRANVMWAATMALNGLIGAGVPGDWSVHAVGHELTEMYGIDHARTLAVVLPAMWRVLRREKGAKILQYGRRVLKLEGDDETATDQAVARTVAFFEDLGIPTRLSAYGIGAEAVPAIVAQLESHCLARFGAFALGERQTVTAEVVEKVLKAAL